MKISLKVEGIYKTNRMISNKFILDNLISKNKITKKY